MKYLAVIVLFAVAFAEPDDQTVQSSAQVPVQAAQVPVSVVPNAVHHYLPSYGLWNVVPTVVKTQPVTHTTKTEVKYNVPATVLTNQPVVASQPAVAVVRQPVAAVAYTGGYWPYATYGSYGSYGYPYTAYPYGAYYSGYPVIGSPAYYSALWKKK